MLLLVLSVFYAQIGLNLFDVASQVFIGPLGLVLFGSVDARLFSNCSTVTRQLCRFPILIELVFVSLHVPELRKLLPEFINGNFGFEILFRPEIPQVGVLNQGFVALLLVPALVAFF